MSALKAKELRRFNRDAARILGVDVTDPFSYAQLLADTIGKLEHRLLERLEAVYPGETGVPMGQLAMRYRAPQDSVLNTWYRRTSYEVPEFQNPHEGGGKRTPESRKTLCGLSAHVGNLPRRS